MQELDAQRRLAILRGEEPPPLEETTDAKEEAVESRNSVPVGYPGGSQRARKRKRYGEDDTDFELRLAKERDSLNVARTDNAVSATRKPTSSAPIVDHAGHIDLFGDDKTRAHAEKNEEAEKEAKKKKQEYEDQYTMRFANATGRHGTNNPWYSHSSSDLAAVAAEPPSKDVWGNEDPRRREREAQRTVANDPLAMMKKGASKVRELKQERKKFQEERDEELRQLRREERHEEKRRRRHKHESRLAERSPSRHSSRRRRRSRDAERERGYADEDELARKKRRHHSDRDDGRRHRRDSRSPRRNERR